MAVSAELQRWLEAVMLDEDLLKQAIADVESTFGDFCLSDDERAFLRNPELDGSDDHFRPMIIRLINSFNKENTSMIARFPEQSQQLRKFIGGMLQHPVASDSKRMTTIATSMIDLLHEEETRQDRFKTPCADKCDIRIVGLGMRSVDQLTREARRAIAGTKAIYLVDNSPGIARYFHDLGVEVIDLSVHYEEGKDRLQTYIEMSKDVISGAITNGPVSFGLYGHPTVFAYPPFVIKFVAESLGLTVGVVPGISAMDCMFAELMIDPATDGMQMFEATDVVIRQRQLLTDVQTLIWQIGALETGLYSRKSSSRDRFAKFLDHVFKFFPEDHPATAIFVSDSPLIPTIIYNFRLRELPDYAHKLHGGFTLHIPPVSSAPVRDYASLTKLKSKEHLDALTADIDQGR